MLAVDPSPVSPVEFDTCTVMSCGSAVTALTTSVVGTAGWVVSAVASLVVDEVVLVGSSDVVVTGVVVSFWSFSPGNGSSLMMASNSARMASSLGTSLPSSSVIPGGGHA